MKKQQPSKGEYVGYCVPPNHSKFKTGNFEHLKRRKKASPNIANDIREFLTETIPYREGRNVKYGRRIDVQLLKLKTAALKGDLRAIELLIDMRENPGKFAKFTKTILVFDEVDALV